MRSLTFTMQPKSITSIALETVYSVTENNINELDADTNTITHWHYTLQLTHSAICM